MSAQCSTDLNIHSTIQREKRNRENIFTDRQNAADQTRLPVSLFSCSTFIMATAVEAAQQLHLSEMTPTSRRCCLQLGLLSLCKLHSWKGGNWQHFSLSARVWCRLQSCCLANRSSTGCSERPCNEPRLVLGGANSAHTSLPKKRGLFLGVRTSRNLFVTNPFHTGKQTFERKI